ncbi:MAG: hypothetical protein EOO99_01045 [Pedobacter sp.]|nr:MAG: hypothetical protein EOO99_01045 [Pedobacter sp.]
MFKQLNNLAGGEYYLMASLLIFLVFFLIIAFYIFKLSKGHIEMMSELPIADNQIPTHSPESTHEKV